MDGYSCYVSEKMDIDQPEDSITHSWSDDFTSSILTSTLRADAPEFAVLKFTAAPDSVQYVELNGHNPAK
jgi:hypothetical protein